MGDEVGWLIERGTSSSKTPAYWAGPGLGAGEPIVLGDWTHDNQKAIRFARQIDAERVASTIKQGTHVTEHIWSAITTEHTP